MTRQEQPQRIRLVTPRDGFVERRRSRLMPDDEGTGAPAALPGPPARPISAVELYWVYAAAFVLCSGLGGFLIAALGLFEGIGR